MILGIGIDIVEVNRFAAWQNKSSAELLRIFSEQEIAYCLSDEGAHAAARFSARFAAREAFFKAYQAMLAAMQIEGKKTLLAVQKAVHVVRLPGGAPMLSVAWEYLLPKEISQPNVHISMSHTAHLATATVLLEKRP